MALLWPFTRAFRDCPPALFHQRIAFVLGLLCVLLAFAPLEARDGRILITGRPLETTYRHKSGVRYLPIYATCQGLGLPTTAVDREDLVIVESPLSGKVQFLLAQGQAQLGGRVERLRPEPIEREGRWYVPVNELERLLGIITTTGEAGDLHVSGRAAVHATPAGLEISTCIPAAIKGFYLDNPPRYVLDLPGLTLDKRYEGPFASTDPSFSAIRVGQNQATPPIVRIVWDLKDSSYRPAAARTGGQTTLVLGSVHTEGAFPSTRVRIGLSRNGAGCVVEGLYASSATLERDGDALMLRFDEAHLAGEPVDYHRTAEMTDTGISTITVRNRGEQVIVRVVPSKAAPNATLTFDKTTQRATLLLDPSKATMPDTPTAPVPTGSQGHGSLRGKRIVIDAGHGGHDPGATMEPGMVGPTQLMEKEITLRMSLDLAERLRRAGAVVTLTRDDDTFVELNARREVGTAHDADLFLSIHCNSFRKIPSSVLSGTEVYYYKAADAPVADHFYRHVAAHTGRGGRGALQANFVVVKHPTIPSVLIEAGYLSNPDEYALFVDPSHRYERTLVDGMVDGVNAFFGGASALPVGDPEIFTEILPAAADPLGDLTMHDVMVLAEASGLPSIPAIPVPGTAVAVTPTLPSFGAAEPRLIALPATGTRGADLPDRGLRRGDIFGAPSDQADGTTTVESGDQSPKTPQEERRHLIFSLESL